jgi:WD40 repeat protein
MSVQQQDPVYYLSLPNAVLSLAFDLDCTHLATGESDGTVSVFDLRSWRCLRKINDASPQGICWLRFDAKGRLMVQSRDGVARRYGAEWKPDMTLHHGHGAFCKGDALEKESGDLVALPKSTSQVVVYRIKDELANVISDLSAEEADAGNVMTIVFIDEMRLLAAYEAAKIVLWDIVAGVSLFSLPTGEMTPTGLDFDSEKDCGIICGSSGKILTFSLDRQTDVLTEVGVRTIPAEGAATVAIRRPDKRIAVAGCWDSTLRLFSWKKPERLKPLGALKFHSETVEAVAFSSEPVKSKGGKRLVAAAGKDGKVSFWDVYSD